MSGECDKCGEHCLQCRCNHDPPDREYLTLEDYLNEIEDEIVQLRHKKLSKEKLETIANNLMEIVNELRTAEWVVAENEEDS